MNLNAYSMKMALSIIHVKQQLIRQLNHEM